MSDEPVSDGLRGELHGAVAGESQTLGEATVSSTRSSDAATPERIADLEARLAQTERELASEREAATDYMQRWQRAQADFSNLRRRAQQEQEQLQRLAAARALAGILPAVDSFERAFATLPPTLRQFSWIDGVGLVHLQLHGALQAAGIRAFAPDRGSAFDPRTQQAIGDIETRDAAPGTVAVVVQQGYLLGDMVLRPALIQLARAPQEASTTEVPLEASSTTTQAEPAETQFEGGSLSGDEP
ncbi:MAG TPA: nucleotide exchange factor GrpE [Ktedonobacterales bacterium]